MFTLFVIGNIASGKSTASRYLASRGAWYIDLDELAKSLYDPGSPVVDELVDAFGCQVLNEAGGIDTRSLAEAAFCDDERVRRLNAIVHPAVLDRLSKMLTSPERRCAKPEQYPLAVVEVSVAQSFIEAFSLADEIVAISAPLCVRRDRALGRGMSESDFDARAALQPSEDELCGLATVVIENDGGAEALKASLDALIQRFGIELSSSGGNNSSISFGCTA